MEEVGDFYGCEVVEPGDYAPGGDQDVAGEEGSQVYEAEGVRGCVEDLG